MMGLLPTFPDYIERLGFTVAREILNKGGFFGFRGNIERRFFICTAATADWLFVQNVVPTIILNINDGTVAGVAPTGLGLGFRNLLHHWDIPVVDFTRLTIPLKSHRNLGHSPVIPAATINRVLLPMFNDGLCMGIVMLIRW